MALRQPKDCDREDRERRKSGTSEYDTTEKSKMTEVLEIAVAMAIVETDAKQLNTLIPVILSEISPLTIPGDNPTGYYWTEESDRLPIIFLQHCVWVSGRYGDGAVVGRIIAGDYIIPARIDHFLNIAVLSWWNYEMISHFFEVLLLPGDDVEYEWVSASGGHVPPDALPVGKTRDGGLLYTARGRKKHGQWLGGMVCESHKACLAPEGGRVKSFRRYQVLVVRNRAPGPDLQDKKIRRSQRTK